MYFRVKDCTFFVDEAICTVFVSRIRSAKKSINRNSFIFPYISFMDCNKILEEDHIYRGGYSLEEPNCLLLNQENLLPKLSLDIFYN